MHPPTQSIVRSLPPIGLLGVLMIALATAWRFVLAFVAPAHEAKRLAYLDRVRAWQHEQLLTLREKPFQELQAMPSFAGLTPPEEFHGEHFAVVRADGENGGVEVGVAHFHQVAGVTLGYIVPRFEMLANGSIVERDAGPDD